MGSDIARITYDESRQYCAVVMQQGRVTVEADWNEEEQIVNEEMRKAALDFVGPNGTPDNGYRVIETFTSPPEASPPEAPFDFSVDKGTIYVGGVRAFSADPIQYSQQPDWLDYLGDPDWVDLSTLANAPPQQEFIYLYLREQEVSAVEDSALREVALGGPDTAQRLRLIQHIVRQETGASTCPTALAAAQTKWAAEGLNFDDRTMRLVSATTLQVSFSDGLTTPTPCEPEAQVGYLGAYNQLIRVQVGLDQATQTNTLVWGFDNASFLYRVTVADDLRTLRLLSCPVDDLHKPRANQAVEVLRSAAQLSATTDDYVASTTGFVATLEKDYASDTQSITLPTPLPAEYKDASQTPVVFLRVWEEEVKSYTPGATVPLGTTGLQVTLRTSGNEPLHVGDYWLFAARPDTAADPSASTQIFPHRYLEGTQPPDGPRLWACPLAVIEWTGGVLQTVENGDCRNLFDNLVKLSKKDLCACCNVLVNPVDLTGSTTLQTIVDSFRDGDFVTVCLTPGVYSLSDPLQLTPRHSHLTLESCQGGVTIQAAPGQESNFLDGLIVLNHADNVTLRGLRFEMPVVPFTQAGGTIANIEPSTLSRIAGAFLQNGLVSIGIRPVDCASLTVQDCFFHFPGSQNQFLNGFGIFAAGDCQGLTTVRGNAFMSDQGFNEQTGLFGYSLDDTLQFTSGIDLTAQASNIPAGSALPALLQDAYFQDNQFTGLNGAVNIAANIGAVKIEGNTIQNCENGFTLMEQGLPAFAALVDEVSVNRGQLALAQQLRKTILDMMLDPGVQLTSVFARGYPLPRGFDMSKAIRVTAQNNHTTTEAERRPIQRLFDRVSAVLGEGSSDAATEKVKVVEGASRRSSTPFASGLERLNALLSAFERVALTQHASPAGLFTLSMSGNDIALNPIRKGTSALAVSLSTPGPESAMTLSDNRMQQDQAEGYTVYISGVSRCAMTGNLISSNSSSGGQALLVSVVRGITMSTNTLQGRGADPNSQRFSSTAVQIAAGPEGATLTGNLISNDSPDAGALQVSGGILMSTNIIQGQGTIPTVTISSGTADSTLTGNQIANNNSTSGSALVVQASGLTMSANSAQNQSINNSTVQIAAGTADSTITGNLIANGERGGTSLQYMELSGLEAAITGNVLLGTAVLPPRGITVPSGLEFLNTWDFVNTIA